MELETRHETALGVVDNGMDNILEEINTTVDDSQLFQAVKTVPVSHICLQSPRYFKQRPSNLEIVIRPESANAIPVSEITELNVDV